MKNISKLLLAALAVAGFVQVATAVPTPPTTAGLYLVDTATGDFAYMTNNANYPYFNYNGTVGDYSINITVGGTVISNGVAPNLDLDVANATAGSGATTLQVYFSAGAFGPTLGNVSLVTTGPASGGPIVSSAYLGTNYFNMLTTLASSVDVYPYTVNGSHSVNTNSYYLTLEELITGSEVSVDSHLTTTVPEPSTLLLGFTGLGLALAKYRRRG